MPQENARREQVWSQPEVDPARLPDDVLEVLAPPAVRSDSCEQTRPAQLMDQMGIVARGSFRGGIASIEKALERIDEARRDLDERLRLQEESSDTLHGNLTRMTRLADKNFESALTTATKALESIVWAKGELEKRLDQLETHVADSEEAVVRLRALESEREVSREKVTSLKGWLETTISAKNSLNAELAFTRDELSRKSEEYENLLGEVGRLRVEIEKARESKREAEVVLEARDEQIVELERQHSGLQSEVVRHREQIDRVRAERQVPSRSELEENLARTESHAGRRSDLLRQVEEAEAERARLAENASLQADGDGERIRADLDRTRREAAELRQRLRDSEKARERAEQIARERDDRLEDLLARRRDLEKQLEIEHEAVRSAEGRACELAARAGDPERLSRLRNEVEELLAAKKSDGRRMEELAGRLDALLGENREMEVRLAGTRETLMKVLRRKIDLEVTSAGLNRKVAELEAAAARSVELADLHDQDKARLNALSSLLAGTRRRRQELECRLREVHEALERQGQDNDRARSEIEDLKSCLSRAREDKRTSQTKVRILEKRLRHAPDEGSPEDQDSSTGTLGKKLVQTFDYLFNPRQGYPILDHDHLVALVRKILGGLRSDPASALDLGYYTANGYLKHHVLNVTRLALYLGMHAGYKDASLEALGVCSLLHDIGMVSMPDSIFDRPDGLSLAERDAIRRHPEVGVGLYREIETTSDLLGKVVTTIVVEHHERLDGTGYPSGKKGDQIHEFTKLISIVDGYEAMVSPRVYRKELIPHEGIKRLAVEAGRGAYSKELVHAFIRAMSLYPIGSYLELAGGEIAKVVASNPEDPKRPVVRLVTDDSRSRVARPVFVDLLAEKDAVVKGACPAP